MKELYKKDSKGKIRMLKVYTEKGELFQESGMLNEDGEINKPVIHGKECKPKNVGKSNATTNVQQAVAEMEALVTKKLREGYFNTKEEAEEEEVLLPMLAKEYGKEESKIDWEGDVFIQPKLDGMRCLAIIKDGKVTLISRKNKVIETMGHIVKAIEEQYSGDDIVLDGELYAHGETFQDNMKLIKKYREGESERVTFNVYDVVSTEPFIKRYYSIPSIVTIEPRINIVNTMRLVSKGGLKTIHELYIKDGYEGSMIRHGDEGYKVNGRSSSLLKFKEFQDIAAEIIDIEPSDSRPEWGTPVLKYSNKKMSGVSECTFKAGTKMSHEERAELLTNKEDYIGKTAEIRFFEWTDDGVPRFPVMVGVRLDK